MMIFCSIMVIQHSHNIRVIASLCESVRVGILLGDEYVIIGLSSSLDTKNIWF
ncbi:hypothetical protein [Bartonella silvatica]|uniref:hypothetical protein n=1 Tax=Bartonella silvatica TaxID=357760 RepID=UPI00339761F1